MMVVVQRDILACHLYDAKLNSEGPTRSLESEHVN